MQGSHGGGFGPRLGPWGTFALAREFGQSPNLAPHQLEMPWQAMAQDRDRWADLESDFVSKALRVPLRQVHALPPGRHMMPDTRAPREDARTGTQDDQWT